MKNGGFLPPSVGSGGTREGIEDETEVLTGTQKEQKRGGKKLIIAATRMEGAGQGLLKKEPGGE